MLAVVNMCKITNGKMPLNTVQQTRCDDKRGNWVIRINELTYIFFVSLSSASQYERKLKRIQHGTPLANTQEQ